MPLLTLTYPVTPAQMSGQHSLLASRKAKGKTRSKQHAHTCGHAVQFRAALGELAGFAADIRILLFSIQCCVVVAGEPEEGVVRFTSEVA